MKPLLDIALSLRLDRRGFLASIGAVLYGLSHPERGNAKTVWQPEIVALQRAVYLQIPYFDFTGHGETYTPPRGNQTTRDYLAGLTTDKFLRRHWFS